MGPGDVEALEIEVVNRVLGSEARRRAIDDAVRGAFDRVTGEWRVTVSEVKHFSPPWWWVSVQGRSELFEVCFRPSEQDAQQVRGRIVEALRLRRHVRSDA
jgi:hypothetical protein